MESYLGRGWKFPVQVDPKTGRIQMSEYDEDISEAIRIILKTVRGERLMRADFGCGIQRFVFDLTNEVTMHKLEEDIKESIMIWEPRVGEVEVKAALDAGSQGKVMIEIHYIVRSTNNRKQIATCD
jgi:hypothetical protein